MDPWIPLPVCVVLGILVFLVKLAGLNISQMERIIWTFVKMGAEQIAILVVVQAIRLTVRNPIVLADILDTVALRQTLLFLVVVMEFITLNLRMNLCNITALAYGVELVS